MRAALTFRQRGFNVRQSFFYESRGENTMREGDVLASLSHDVIRDAKTGRFRSQRAVASLEMGIVCECKTSSDPWVMFTREPRKQEGAYGRLERAASEAGEALITTAFTDMGTSKAFPFFRDPLRVGYQLRVAHIKKDRKEGRDLAYQGATQVVDAALAALDMSMSRWAIRWRPCRFVVPVLVLQAPLYECFLADDDSIRLEPATQLSLFWENPLVPDRNYTVIDVVTLSALAEYADAAKEAFDHLRERHEETLVEVCTRAPEE